MGSRRPLWWGCWEDSGRCSWRGNGAVVSRWGLLDHCGAPWLLTLSLLGASGQTSAQKWHDLIRIATRSPFLLCWKWTQHLVWKLGDHLEGFAIIQVREDGGLDQGVNGLNVWRIREKSVSHQGLCCEQRKEGIAIDWNGNSYVWMKQDWAKGLSVMLVARLELNI